MPKVIRIATIPLAFKNLLRGQLAYMSKNGFDVIAISATGKDIPNIKEYEGCAYIVVPMTRKITPISDLVCLFKLVKILIKEKPDIVHTHTPKAGLLGMMGAKIAGVKYRIHTVAGLPLMVEKGVKRKLLVFIERVTNFCATNVWPNSFSLQKYIVDNKLCPIRKLAVISKGSSNGINTVLFNKTEVDAITKINLFKKVDHAYDSQNCYLLFIGRLVKDKGIVELVESFIKISSNRKNVFLMLVGDFEQELDPLPEHVCSEIRNNPKILFFGWQNEVALFYKVANIFVFPSYREGFPNVLLQAGASGIPIVCSRIEGNVDVVENECGLLFEKANSESLYEALLFMMDNKAFCDTCALNLFSKIQAYYSNERVWEELKNNYLKILQDK